ncbi:hypothetical protein BH23GEM6_BH23GEM6_25800 [soil metagenome]
MIQPNVRVSFGRAEAELLLSLAGPEGERRLRDHGLDSLLDDASLVRAVLQRPGLETPPAPLVFYLLVRHALLEREVLDRQIADYTAAVLLEFGRLFTHLPDTLISVGSANGTFYLADVIGELDQARGERELELRAHLGNLSLWLAGVFPDHVAYRVQRRGAPPLSYYDELGVAGFRSAGQMQLAINYGLGDLFLQIADRFSDVRSALNGLSDALFFPSPKSPVERVLREVRDDFQRKQGGQKS